ncbi:uncharacterized protein BDW70DRAFT_154432 [Aspergillus foveolatus]|uniref:uncharacterized protein n=1 Tax=Aspergillus foveolatus TaxID=210207 RepID=UPI003CCCE4DD
MGDKLPTIKQNAAVEAACKQMLSLKDRCLHLSTGKPYIQSALGGKDNSPETFIVEFAVDTDRGFYIAQDSVHQEFVRSLDGLVETAQVVDFTPGIL